MPTKPGDQTSMGAKGKHMPPFPRARLGEVTLLPKVDEEWQPIAGMWVLPGRGVLDIFQLRDLADARGLALTIINS